MRKDLKHDKREIHRNSQAKKAHPVPSALGWLDSDDSRSALAARIAIIERRICALLERSAQINSASARFVREPLVPVLLSLPPLQWAQELH